MGNMKLFIIAALLASVYAEPESEAKADAKPWVSYGSALGYAGYPHVATYAGAVGYPYASAYGLGYNGYALGTHYLGKRSADSDSEAKPWLAYANTAYGAYPYSTYASGVYGYPAATYAHAGYARLGYAGVHYLGKRSADGEAEAKPDAYYGYSAYGYPGYRSAYHLGYGLGYGHRVGYGLGYGYGGYAYGK